MLIEHVLPEQHKQERLSPKTIINLLPQLYLTISCQILDLSLNPASHNPYFTVFVIPYASSAFNVLYQWDKLLITLPLHFDFWLGSPEI